MVEQIKWTEDANKNPEKKIKTKIIQVIKLGKQEKETVQTNKSPEIKFNIKKNHDWTW